MFSGIKRLIFTFFMTTALANDKIPGESKAITEQDLYTNPHLFNQVLQQSLAEQNIELLAELAPRYSQYPQRDYFLATYAEAVLARETGDYDKALLYLQSLIDESPNDIFLRFQYAQILLVNRKILEAEKELQLLRDDKIPEDLSVAVEALLAQIEKQKEWNLLGNFYYTYDENINNAPESKTYGNWSFEEPEKAHGLHWSLGTTKNFLLNDGYYIPFRISVNVDDYNARQYDEWIARLQSGFGWRNGRYDFSAQPYLQIRNLGDKTYSKSLGLFLSARYQINKNWNISASNNFFHEKHASRKHLDGNRWGQNISLVWQPENSIYYYGNLNHYRYKAKDKDDSYRLFSLGLGLGKSWEDSFEISSGGSISFKKHDDNDFFGIRRNEKIYRLNLGFAHSKINWRGYQPSLVLNWEKTASNHFYYQQNWKFNSYIEIEKRF